MSRWDTPDASSGAEAPGAFGPWGDRGAAPKIAPILPRWRAFAARAPDILPPDNGRPAPTLLGRFRPSCLPWMGIRHSHLLGQGLVPEGTASTTSSRPSSGLGTPFAFHPVRWVKGDAMPRSNDRRHHPWQQRRTGSLRMEAPRCGTVATEGSRADCERYGTGMQTQASTDRRTKISVSIFFDNPQIIHSLSTGISR